MTLFRKKYYTVNIKRKNKVYKIVLKFPFNVESYFVDEQVKAYRKELYKLVEYILKIEEIKTRLPFEVKKIVEIDY